MGTLLLYIKVLENFFQAKKSVHEQTFFQQNGTTSYTATSSTNVLKVTSEFIQHFENISQSWPHQERIYFVTRSFLQLFLPLRFFETVRLLSIVTQPAGISRGDARTFISLPHNMIAFFLLTISAGLHKPVIKTFLSFSSHRFNFRLFCSWNYFDNVIHFQEKIFPQFYLCIHIFSADIIR